MAKDSNNHISNNCSVEILSADNMGCVITTGSKDFDFGILIPQYILLDGKPIPYNSSISLIKDVIYKGEKIEVKPLRILEKQNSKFALVTLNVKGVNEFKKEFNKLKEGHPYNVTIDSENEIYYCIC